MKRFFIAALICTAMFSPGAAQENAPLLTFPLQTDSLMKGIAMESAMQVADSAGAEILLDLTASNPAVIERFRERIWAILEKYTDILVISPKEAYALTHLPPEQAADFLKNFCPVIIIKNSDTER